MLPLLLILASTLLGADTLLVSPAWLAAHLGAPDVVVVQVDRDPTGYDAGHIPGSRFLALASIVVERDGITNELPAVAVLDSVLESVGIGDGNRVVITGDPLGAARLFFTLDYLGHGDRAALLDGGTARWIAEQRPVTREPASSAHATFTPDVQAGRLAEGDWVERHLHAPRVRLLDARPPADYLGTAGSSPPSGHIPGARNIFWRTTLEGSPPVLLDQARLDELFRAAGVQAGDTVVAYCRTGIQASFLYFVARYLGYDVKMYDGSFAEWSRRPGAPIETGRPR